MLFEYARQHEFRYWPVSAKEIAERIGTTPPFGRRGGERCGSEHIKDDGNRVVTVRLIERGCDYRIIHTRNDCYSLVLAVDYYRLVDELGLREKMREVFQASRTRHSERSAVALGEGGNRRFSRPLIGTGIRSPSFGASSRASSLDRPMESAKPHGLF